MIMKDSIVINASAEKVYNYQAQRMTDLKSYKEWHEEHVDLKWLKGKPVTKGSIVYIEEYLGDTLQKLTF
ncbi:MULTISPECIES: SRPBCC family protein [unclassified Oceanispirochaeta]|uniref:SRPBCC family protein n=1 Tax=unclassified Oceanispirochaeta TaxID=2635722 RepID=UPI000E095644|nr:MULTISPECIES: SRPBCC family protein [unclassified Oceanispirochaeta]MBF9018812.1 SRPBCC family protein [Oceanispirochaeta sp. M2]NPD75281.1 SRPBCC family protein [Oceanispirochaeta sp. M1]RDG28872.1 SRPBCC family protein [Oceanispirochaeta sp. M1]